MSFNNRKVCSINVDYDLNQLIDRISNQSFFIRNENNSQFRNKIDIILNYNDENINFYYCRFGFEMETERIIPDIREDNIVDVRRNVVDSYALPFWISDNGFILFNSLNNTFSKKGKSLLSNFLFRDPNAIVENTFDINEITDAVENGMFNNMWNSSFSGRHNNIRGGTLNGINVNEDTMFEFTGDAEKTTAGIFYEIPMGEIKVKFFRSGTVQLLMRELPMDDPSIFIILSEFQDYIL